MRSGKLSDQIAVVTGGARGIGRAIAARLAGEGASVVIGDIDIDHAEQSAVEIGGDVTARMLDIGDPTSVARFCAFVQERFGRCEILVNNAAILNAAKISEMKMDEYLRVVDINQHGAVRMTMAMLPLLRVAGSGSRVINIASIMGVRGSRDSIPYSTAKGGIVNFTRALACDLAPEGMTVNAIAPGFVDTAMAHLPDGSGHEYETEWFREVYIKHGRIPLGRPGVPEDVAGPALFLCSDDAKYITGQILMVDGGVSATF